MTNQLSLPKLENDLVSAIYTRKINTNCCLQAKKHGHQTYAEDLCQKYGQNRGRNGYPKTIKLDITNIFTLGIIKNNEKKHR